MLSSVVIVDKYAGRIGNNHVDGIVYFQVTAYDQDGRAIPASALTSISWMGSSCGGGRTGVTGPTLHDDVAGYRATRPGTCTATASVTAFGRTLVGTGTANVIQ